MICQECHERPAVLHFTKTVNGKMTEVYLCEHCANEKGEHLFSGHPAFSLNNLLGGLFNPDPQFSANPSFHEQEVHCENCHMTFKQFLQSSKFGCAHCYETFESKLTPLLKRLHGGNTIHHGKIPARMGGQLHLQKELQQLREKLQEMVTSEQFEQAANIRDQIRALEKKLLNEGGVQ
nr:UvrB/UvrC motif-containing protein [Domibacillus indicus]